MSLLLDTHAVLWWLAGEPLGDAATQRIADPGTLVYVSAASVWEVAIKRTLGKVRLDGALAEAVEQAGFEPLRISLEHAERAGALPDHHRDPFDRMLVAQAQLESLAVVTRDRRLAAYEVDTVPC